MPHNRFARPTKATFSSFLRVSLKPGPDPIPGRRLRSGRRAGVDRLLMCVCYLGTMDDLWLIPVRDGLAAVDAALEPVGNSVPPTAEELRSLADVAMRYVLVSETLLRYAEAVSGWHCRN